MTCKDCVHYEVCKYFNDFEGIPLYEGEASDCGKFKPKSRFVEVVRCKDCKYRGDYACPMVYEQHIDYDDDGYFESDYILHDKTTDEGFCDYGERSKHGTEEL